jgi:hypothetical protein
MSGFEFIIVLLGAYTLTKLVFRAVEYIES